MCRDTTRGEGDVVKALEAAGHEPAVFRFDRGTETALSSAEALGVEVSRIVKSLVFSVDGEPVLVLVPGDRRADAKAVARAAGGRKARLADPSRVLRWTGYPVGAVPPVGHPTGIRVLMDSGIRREGPVYPSAGEVNNAFETTFEDLLRLTGAAVCDVAAEPT